MLYTILYISNPCNIYSKDELIDLINNTKKWSNIHDVTGCLAYIEGSHNGQTQCQLIHVLEGSEVDVKKVFIDAERNIRAGKLSLIKEGHISKRKFNDWTAGIERIKISDHPLFEFFFIMNGDVLSGDGNLNDNMLMQFMVCFSRHQMSLRKHHGSQIMKS